MSQKDFKIDFIGIGAQRSATTWIAECLREHPQTCLARSKELNFFEDPKYKFGLDWYKKHFIIKKEHKFLGEYTSTYIYSRKAAERIKNHFPEIKIIVSLRNPIERFISHLPPDRKFDNLENNIDLVDKGFYYKHLKVYFDLFPKENILVMIYENIEKDPRVFISKIYQFIGADSFFIPASLEKRINPKRRYKFSVMKKLLDSGTNFLDKGKTGVYLKKFLVRIGMRRVFYAIDEAGSVRAEKTVIPEEIKKRLKDIYRDDVKKLEELLNRELWKDI